MITFHNVDKRYKVRSGYKVILDHASAHLPARNIGILAGNGVGKSTLLRMISGAERPNSGQIECHRRVSFPLGFSGSFNGSLSGIENALFTSRIYGQDTEGVIDYVKEFSQLGEQLYMPVKTYSSGMRARLAFGISLAIDFELYLVDEITAVGDARFRKRSQQAFRNKLGKAHIIMVSHGMSTLRDYCDAGVVLQDGQMIYYDDLEEAIRHHNWNMRSDDGAPVKFPGKPPGKPGPKKPMAWAAGQPGQGGQGRAAAQQAGSGKNLPGGKGPAAGGKALTGKGPNPQQGGQQLQLGGGSGADAKRERPTNAGPRVAPSKAPGVRRDPA